VDRIVDVFPPYQQEQIRVLLSNTVEAIVAQQLLPIASGRGRIPVVEVMIANAGIRNLIREGKTHQLYSMMETGGSQHMQTMDRSLVDLYRRGLITHEQARMHAVDLDNFSRLSGMAK
jgi:twitching motility protein PilT